MAFEVKKHEKKGLEIHWFESHNPFFLFSVGISFFGQNNLSITSKSLDNGPSNSYKGESKSIITYSNIIVTHPSDFTLNISDSTNQMISWTLTENNSDYLGLYSFTNDTDGALPTGWTTSTPSGTSISVISGLYGHTKVVEMIDNATCGTYMTNTFSSRVTGTIELYMLTSKINGGGAIQFSPNNIVGVWKGPYLQWRSLTSSFDYYDGSWHTIMGVVANHWYHIRIQWNCTSSKWHLWMDGVQKDVGAGYRFDGTATSLNMVCIYAGDGTYTARQYIDAIDYSWAPGYYLNRNMEKGNHNYNYDGLYSFTNDSDGSVPSGWTRPYHIGNTEGYVGAEKAGHHKVIAMYDNNPKGYTILRNTFQAQLAGTVEFWFYGDKAMGSLCGHQFLIYTPTSGGIYLAMDTTHEVLCYYDGSAWHNICNLSNKIWHHLRVKFNCTLDKFDIWVDNIQRATDCSFDGYATNITTIDLYTGYVSTGGFYVYFDAFDFSWAPEYFMNRNMKYSNLTYAIFNDGTQKTPWQSWANQVRVSYNVSGSSLGLGIHNISLVFNDRNGKWFHNDVTITIVDLEKPNILEIIQNPVNPAYLKPVNVTAHITDATQVQTVMIQTNYTGTLSFYPMTLISGSSKDGVWKYSFKNYSCHAIINYCIYTRDIFGNFNSSAQSSFGTFDFAPKLLKETVSPPGGTQFTNFIFRVIYQDDDNDPPSFINVLINGTHFQLAKADPTDLNYRDGCIYQYQTVLAIGTYYYSFRCSDGFCSNSTKNNGMLIVNKTNQFAPTLSVGTVTPNTGTQLTNFTFKVVYRDADNDAPRAINVLINGEYYPMAKENPSDNNFLEGVNYQFKTQLTPGTHSYSFECCDGKYTNSLSIIYLGLTVYDANVATITNFAIIRPQNVIKDKTPEIICRIFVSGAGINISSVQYAYSTTGNQNPTNWAAVNGVFLDAECTIPAHNGAIGYLYLKVNAVPFNQGSLTKNTIRFRASDLAGIQFIQSTSENIKIEEETASTNPINPIMIIIMIVAGVTSTYSVNLFLTTYKKEHKFKSIVKKVLNEAPGLITIDSTTIINSQPNSNNTTRFDTSEIEENHSIPIFIDSVPPITTTEALSSYNPSSEIEEFEPAMVFKEIMEDPQRISYYNLLHVLNTVLQFFPPLSNYFQENLLSYLNDLIDLPDTEIFDFFTTLIEKVPENELRKGLNELKCKFRESDLIKEDTEIVVPQIKGLFNWIELIQDRKLLDNLSIFLILSVIQLTNPTINS